MDNLETLATLEKPEGAIKNGQLTDISNIGHTTHMKIESLYFPT
jgi:hypothetical protein